MKFKVLVGLIFVFLLTGCERENLSDYKEDTRYFRIITNEYCGNIVYDTRTGVEYWYSTGAYNGGTLTVLVDENGKPLIYDSSKGE